MLKERVAIINLSYSQEIIVAVVSNPNFFEPSKPSESKIEQVCKLIETVTKTIESK